MQQQGTIDQEVPAVAEGVTAEGVVVPLPRSPRLGRPDKIRNQPVDDGWFLDIDRMAGCGEDLQSRASYRVHQELAWVEAVSIQRADDD